MCLWKTPKISTNTVTARDLTPSTESETPDSPSYGGSDEWKKQKTGAQALQISKGTHTNQKVDTGGWNI